MIKLVETCGACPEQYDAYLDGTKVGYLRLRHGYFYVECPYDSDNVVYHAYPEGKGAFADDERDYYLRFAVDAIQHWLENPVKTKLPAPDVEYEIVEKTD